MMNGGKNVIYLSVGHGSARIVGKVRQCTVLNDTLDRDDGALACSRTNHCTRMSVASPYASEEEAHC